MSDFFKETHTEKKFLSVDIENEILYLIIKTSYLWLDSTFKW